VPDGDCKKVDDQNRDTPAAEDIEKGERKAEQNKRLVEDAEERVVQHDKAEDEKNHPGLF
jgi:hypothetical protein